MVYEGDVLQRSGRRRIMDAFVVLTREEYENLTNYSPPEKISYKPGPQYTLTAEDNQRIYFVSSTCKKFIEKYGEEFKRKVIALFRKMLDAPKYQSAQDQKRIHEILVELYTVDKL